MKEHGGTYISVATKLAEDYAVEYGHMEMLETYFKEYIAGTRPDMLLDLALYGDGTWRVPLSQIAYFADNTPQQREANWERRAAIERRQKELHPEYNDD
jgi:hypothetical protein